MKSNYELHYKRILDILLASLGLIILAPVMLVIAVLVRKKLGKPVIFAQLRPGLNEKIFEMYKFRTMTDERDQNSILLPDDKRLTSFGKFLRSTSLDELPEFFNVIKGEMSLVGPRPLLPEYLPLYNQDQKQRHKVKPGITGWAQINGRNAISWEEKFNFDVWYINNINFKLDLKILLKTLFKVFCIKEVSHKGVVTMTKFEGNK